MRAFLPAPSEHSALYHPRLDYPPAPVPSAKKAQKDQYTLLDLYASTRNIRLLTPSSLNASFNFSCGTTLPDETWEVLAHTSEIVLFGVSSITPTIFLGFWESKGKKRYLIKLRAKKKYFFQYKAL